MFKLRKSFLLVIGLMIIFSNDAFALIEIGGSVGYDRQVYGATRQNNLTSRTYSGSLAVYLWEFTAIELNAARTDETNTSNDITSVLDSNGAASGVSVSKQLNIIKTEVYGIGIRQALASRKARIRPMISFGYARQFIKDRTDFTFQDDATLTQVISAGQEAKTREDSVFATITLQFVLLRGLSLNASVKTVFPAFEFDQAKDDMKYLVGFSWAM